MATHRTFRLPPFVSSWSVDYRHGEMRVILTIPENMTHEEAGDLVCRVGWFTAFKAHIVEFVEAG
jgi:hypothetical protein